jgi:predicted RNase H-like HicB family nuclease
MYSENDYKVEIYFSDEDGCFIARAPELEGCVTHGDNLEEAVQMIQQAKALWIETALENKEVLPIPLSKNEYSGKLSLRIDPELHKKTAIAAQSLGDSINKFIEKTLKKCV